MLEALSSLSSDVISEPGRVSRRESYVGTDNEFKYAGRHAERNGNGAAREEMRNRQQGRFTETPWQQRPRANVKRALNR